MAGQDVAAREQAVVASDRDRAGLQAAGLHRLTADRAGLGCVALWRGGSGRGGRVGAWRGSLRVGQFSIYRWKIRGVETVISVVIFKIKTKNSVQQIEAN